jgi:DNA-directed RNA polymerase subunit RPC12/RpoP
VNDGPGTNEPGGPEPASGSDAASAPVVRRRHDPEAETGSREDPPATTMARRVRGLVLLAAVPLGIIAGLVYGWRWVLAPLLGLALLRWLIASLRVFVEDAKDDLSLPPVEDGPERTVFRCPECGTEVLLLYRGTPKAPSHCGQRMDARTELLR